MLLSVKIKNLYWKNEKPPFFDSYGNYPNLLGKP